MSSHPFLLALPCLLLAAIPSHTRPILDVPVSAAGDGNPEPVDPVDRKLIPGTAFDGHFSLNLDYPLSEASGAIGSRAALVARWNPAILGWEARLAAGWVFWSPLGPITEASGPHTRLSKWTLALDEAWLRYPVQAERRSYPSEPYNSLRYLGGPDTWRIDAAPTHWWSGRLHLAHFRLCDSHIGA